MSTLAILGLAALIAAGSSQISPQPQQRAAAPLSAPAATALSKAHQTEQQGRVVDSLRWYREAAAAGSGEAAKRLGDIYWRGAPGVERDLAESLRWYRVAERRGENVAQAMRLR